MHDSGKYWEMRAAQYGERAVGNLSDALWDREENELRWLAIRNNLELKKGMKALEVGTGVGNYAIKLSKKGLVVSANDVSNQLIGIAKDKSTSKKTDVDFICCPIRDLPFRNNTFDVVLDVTVLQHIIEIDDLKQSIRKIVALTKAGGTIAIIEYSPESLPESFEERLRRAEVMVARTTSEWIEEFESQGAQFSTYKGIRFFGYYRGKQSYLKVKNKINRRLLRSGKPASSNCSMLTCWLIYVSTTLIDWFLSKLSYFKDKADTRLLIFKKK